MVNQEIQKLNHLEKDKELTDWNKFYTEMLLKQDEEKRNRKPFEIKLTPEMYKILDDYFKSLSKEEIKNIFKFS